ncbi:MAG: hypothetical protein R6V77_07075 [Candidatus Cloacimonadaceae bacterium]
MRISKLHSLDNYLFSLLIHAALLLLLGLVSYKQVSPINELVIDWITEETPAIVQEDFAPAGSASSLAQAPSQSIINQAIEQNPVVERTSPDRNVARSIEPPTTRTTSTENTAPTAGTGSQYLSGVISNLSGGQSGNNGFLLEDDDGNITIIKSVIPRPRISDYGRVKLQFRINQDGTVDAQSVIPVIIDDPIYTQESIKALKQWRFSVKSYNREKNYRITFIFKPE